MTLYKLLHSIPQEVLLECVRQINPKNDVVLYLNSYHSL